MILRMTRRHVCNVFAILIVCAFCVVCADVDNTSDTDDITDADDISTNFRFNELDPDITTIYKFNELHGSFKSQYNVSELDHWKISSGFVWTYNTMVDVPFPDEGHIDLNLKTAVTTEVLAIDSHQVFAVSSHTSSFNIYFMSDKDPQLGNLIVVRLTQYDIEVLVCNYGKEGDSILLPGMGSRKCLQVVKKGNVKISSYGEPFTLYFEQDKIHGSVSGFLVKLPMHFPEMKYMCVGSEKFMGKFTLRKPARVLALAQSSGYVSHQMPAYSRTVCFNMFYYVDQKSGGEISLYYKKENSTLLGKLFNRQQMGSWQIHRFVITSEEYMKSGRLEIHAKKSYNAPILIHSLQNCDEAGSWDTTTFTKPGNVDIHARTNALGLPFHLPNGSIIGPNVEIEIPPCPNSDQNCEWVLNNWNRVEEYSTEMETAPLPLWREATHNLFSNGRDLSGLYQFSRSLNLHFNVEIMTHNDKELYFYVREKTHAPYESTEVAQEEFEFILLIKLTENNINMFEKRSEEWNEYDYDTENIWIPHHSSVAADSICKEKNQFILTGGEDYHMSLEIIGNQVQVVVEGKTTGKLKCTGTTSYIKGFSAYYLSLATSGMTATAHIDKRVNYMLSPDGEGGGITSPLILPSTDELCVSLLYHKTGGNLTLHAELLDGSRVQLKQLGNTYGWTYKRIIRKLGHQSLRLMLQGSKESGKIIVQRLAGCHPEEDIVKLGQEQNLQVINPISSKKTELILETDYCQNGGLNKGGSCICPPGYSGTHCEQACGSGKFGGDCNGRCSYSTRECKGMLLCKPSWGCSCAPGYKGFFCSEDCEDGEYGADCQQTCSHCASGGCNSFTGLCSEGCQNGYHPPMCQEKCSYYNIAPEVQRAGNKIYIQLHGPILGGGLPLYYQVQYKEDISSPWLTIYSASVNDIVHPGFINITEPSAKDRYFIRAVIINEDACSNQDETIPFAELKTTCEIPDLKMYHLATTDLGENNFTVVWQSPTNNANWCEISQYEVFLKEGREWLQYSTTKSSSLHITQRSPGETYQVKVRGVTTFGDITGFSESVEVKTNILSVAGIQNVKVSATAATQLHLKWEYPYSAKYFVITYKCVKLLGCPHEACDHSKGYYLSSETSATLQDLLPLAQYKVKIAAWSDTLGPSSVLQALTLPEATPTEVEEAIKDRTNTSFTVEWGPPSSCSTLNGFQQGYRYHFRLAGGKTTLIDGSTLQTTASFTNLIPHTQYKVDVFLVTIGGWDEKYPLTISASTKATTPECLANLTVYKSSSREIGLRWAAPAQTCGELQSFTISYVKTAVPSKPISKVISPTSCSAWPDLYCFTVRKLRHNEEYSLSVKACNVEVPEDGDPLSVVAKAQESSPTAPSYIQMVTKDSTTLTIKWGIPWLLNGILQSFLVSVEEVDSFNSSDCCEYFPKREMPVNSEESSYQIEVTGLRPASTYTISVSAKTVNFGPSMHLTAHTKPPVPSTPLQPHVMSEDSDEFKVQLSPVTESQNLVRGYLLLLIPEEQDETFPEATIWDGILAHDIKTAINRSFYIVGEYSQDQLTDDGVVNFLDQEQHRSIGILGELSQFSLISGESYKVILVAVLEYEGAYSFSFKESDTFIAPISFSSST